MKIKNTTSLNPPPNHTEKSNINPSYTIYKNIDFHGVYNSQLFQVDSVAMRPAEDLFKT